MFLTLIYKSLADRKASVLLTIFAMTISITVLLCVEHVRVQAKKNFNNTISGTDLIVGARGGQLNLLLYSVFRIGDPVANISWDFVDQVMNQPDVDWMIPLSLGDSHRGYRVLGTNQNYFEHYQYAGGKHIGFASGHAFERTLDVVIGAEIAQALGYELGDQILLSHGIASSGFNLHENHPFTVVGILAPTGTPIDRTVHVSLKGIEAVHSRDGGASLEGMEDFHPENITAMMLGLKSRMSVFKVQRMINTNKREATMAILPGVALSELWQMMGMMEGTLRLIALLIFISSLLGLCALQISSIRQREREVFLLRAIGARPSFLFMLIQAETLMVSLVSILLSLMTLYGVLTVFSSAITSILGVQVAGDLLSENTWGILLIIVCSTSVIAIAPAMRAYNKSST